jgi:hypothetical protein
MDIASACKDAVNGLVGDKASQNAVERNLSALIVAADEVAMNDPGQETRLPFVVSGNAGHTKEIAIEPPHAHRRHGLVPDLAQIQRIVLISIQK